MAVLLFAGLFGCSAAENTLLELDATQQSVAWTIRYHGHNVMVYSFAPGTYKPYVKELCTLRGDNLLRDAPSDHLHHHALMYGIAINGVDFWSEKPGCGVQKVVKTTQPEMTLNTQGKLQTRFTQAIHWLAPQDAFLPDTSKAALLIEQRTLTLILDEKTSETALHWVSKFEVGSKTNQVKLTGDIYFGLGARFRQDLDPLARHINSGNVPDLNDRRQDVSAGNWGSVSFDMPGEPATFVIYGHPDNPGGRTRFFTMKMPFAYITATQGLDKDPLVYHSGETFQLQYTVLLYPEIKSPEWIDSRVKSGSDSVLEK